ncbi:hypothetical protein Q1695_004236 [Nippostrongylus brasiliensis]|nr:hypothetical protein Q1695_004236 [Nippostrongylus brasiliensis]
MRYLRFLVLLALTTLTDSLLRCYDSGLQEQLCHPVQLWCVKWSNGSTVTRGCADVVLCPDEEDGCFPLHDSTEPDRWCCCNEDFCNASETNLLSLMGFVFLFLSVYI